MLGFGISCVPTMCRTDFLSSRFLARKNWMRSLSAFCLCLFENGSAVSVALTAFLRLSFLCTEFTAVAIIDLRLWPLFCIWMLIFDLERVLKEFRREESACPVGMVCDCAKTGLLLTWGFLSSRCFAIFFPLL